MLSLSVYEPIAMQILLGGPSPKLGEKVELRGLVCYPRKSSVVGAMFLLEPKRYLSPLTSQSQKKFCMGTVPQLGGGVELGGRVWHSAKVLRIR